MSRLLAIDPGNQQSAYVTVDDDLRPQEFGKVDNPELIRLIQDELVADRVVIEMVASYGMAVGADVFETCVWIGRFIQVVASDWDDEVSLIKRNPVKVHLCGSSKAKDGNVAQALRDRFGDKGTKNNPGWFYGFAGDHWQAYALAVYAIDTAA